MSSNDSARISKATQVAILAGVGAASATLAAGYFVLRAFSKSPSQPISANGGARLSFTEDDRLVRGDSSVRSMPRASSGADRGLAATPSSAGSRPPRVRSTFSTCVPPMETDLVISLETCRDLTRSLEKAHSSLDLVRNRSDKDRGRVEMIQSVMDRLRVLETDIKQLVSDGGFEKIEGDEGTSGGWASYVSAPRAGTLSVLSDDSFMSAFEEFTVNLEDDELQKEVTLDKSQLALYQEGIKRATAGEVAYRKARTDFCQCDSDVDFAAKVYCIRLAFEEVLRDEHRRLWLANSGRQLLADILRHSKQDPQAFYLAFDNLMEFFKDERNMDQLAEELKGRGVNDPNFWDVVLDFILLDSFDDLKSPPSAVYSVTKNRWLSPSIQYSTISTIIWSMLKAKRQRLKNPNGFIAHFYNISETVSPAITLGFLGTNESILELCSYFKEQITQFVLDIFSLKRVRYTCVEELADDIWVQMQSRMELVLTRLSSELIPI